VCFRSDIDYPNLNPCASDRSVDPFVLFAWHRIQVFHASEPNSQAPPDSFSPPISAPLAPMFTGAMPPALPEAEMTGILISIDRRDYSRERDAATRGNDHETGGVSRVFPQQSSCHSPRLVNPIRWKNVHPNSAFAQWSHWRLTGIAHFD